MVRRAIDRTGNNAQAASNFSTIIMHLLLMALLLALVGGLGLMGTMSINFVPTPFNYTFS